MEKKYVHSYNSIYCLECGCKFDGNNITDNVCPDCNNTLSQATNYYNGFSVEKRYFEMHVVRSGYQVIRLFAVEKICKKRQKPKYSYKEVMQHWIDSNGDIETLAMNVVTMSSYLDAWTLTGDLEFRTESPSFQQRREISGTLYPYYVKYIPKLLRNGWKGQLLYSPYIYVFSDLLRDEKLETILKAGQLRMFDECASTGLATVWWPQIKIAIRHNYMVEDTRTWFDHLDTLESLELDINNPHYICPADLEKEHNKMLARLRRINDKIAYEKKQEQIEQANVIYQKRMGKLLDIVIEKDDLVIKPLQSVKEFFEEGNIMKHCVFSSNYYERENSIILSATVKGEKVETIEVSLNNLAVKQSRGLRNASTEYNKDIIKLVTNDLRKQMKIAMA